MSTSQNSKNDALSGADSGDGASTGGVTKTTPVDEAPDTVFVIDDDDAMRESLEFLLGSIGLDVPSYATAEDFLEDYDPGRPGCLLTDVRMPGMGGLALLGELRRRGYDVPVVVMTAHADVPMAVRSMRSGAVDFVEKPFNDEELLDCLRRALALDRKQRSQSPGWTPTPSLTATDMNGAPAQLGQYRILRQLGSGGMGDVYLGEDTELGRKVALKFLHLAKSEKEESRARFRQEARAVASLNHVNIVTIYQILEQEDFLCFAMEYVEGRTLRELIKSGELDAEKAVDIALQISEGLAEAHRAGFVHRDIKPENVIVDYRGQAHLLDFGLARSEGAPRITGVNKVVGTPAYMSPEQACGQDAGPHSDVFALAVVLYEMLTGEYPFLGRSPLSLLKAILTDEPKPFPEGRDDIPRELRRVIARALEKDLEDRYPDAAALRDDLKGLRSASLPSAQLRDAVTSVSRPTLASVFQESGVLMLVVAVVLALAVLLIVSL